MAKILIVDDAQFMRAALRQILERNELEVVGEAANGKEAITQYLQLRPDVVTMDITMPDMSGLEALKEILKKDSKAKIVMISAMGQEPIIRECILGGAKNFIVKPFKEETVMKALKSLL